MEPNRRCLGCRQSDVKSNLLRVVAHDGRAIVDREQTLPGRGGYVHHSAECVSQSIRSRAWVRALKEPGLELGEIIRLAPAGNDENRLNG